MKHLLAIVLALSAIGPNIAAERLPKYRQPQYDIEVRVDDLLKRMTFDEKIGQLRQPLYTLKLNVDSLAGCGAIGSLVIANGVVPTVAERDAMQRAAVEKSRLGIPVMFCFDVIHGYRTIYPIPLGAAASWNCALAEDAARMAASEAYANGVDLTFSPMVDVARDARWGRMSECSGEDVLLNSRFGAAAVRGYQGENPSDEFRIGACVKHYAGYGASQGGRDYQFAALSQRALRETYLPPFKACVDAGAAGIMSAFCDIDSTPASADGFILKEVLRNEWGFDGAVISDWNAVVELKNHGIASTDREAAVAAISAGVDIEMTSDCYVGTLKDAIANKELDMKTIDEAVRNVLRLKFRLGLFDKPYRNIANPENYMLTDENRNLARRLAAESMVMVKNNGVLPLGDNIRTISLNGLWAASDDVLGWWHGCGERDDVVTLSAALEAYQTPTRKISLQSMQRKRNCQVAVVCVGEPHYMFGENNCRSDIGLPLGQSELARELKMLGNKVVVVVFNGRALDLTDIEPFADAILIAWHPGVESGNAVADILFGKESPSGKLPVSFPKSVGQIPVYYSDRQSGRPSGDRYVDLDGEPLYAFGFGLSYASFDYSALELSAAQMSRNGEITVRATVTNTGKITAKEVVQLYVHDQKASVTRPQKELVDFCKIELGAGESRVVEFTLKASQLALWNKEMKHVVEQGDFDIWVGGSSDPELHTILTVK